MVGPPLTLNTAGNNAGNNAGRVILLLLLCGLLARAQPAAPQAESADPLHRDSPESSVLSFLEAYHARNFVRAVKYLDLRNLPREQRLADGTRFAQQLGEILDRDTRFDVADLSRNPEGEPGEGLAQNLERVDTFTVNGKTLELQLERITTRSGRAIWLFSSDSVKILPQLSQIASNSAIERYLPVALVSWRLVDTSLWRWIALVILAVALGLLSRLAAKLALMLTEPVLKRISPKMDRSGLRTFVEPLQLLLAVAVFREGMEWIEPSQRLGVYLSRSLAMLFVLGFAWLCVRIADLVIRRVRWALEGRHHTFSHSVLPLASRVLKITILFLALAAILRNWGYDTTTLLTGLGIGSVAIALAAQKTLENVFGGVSVISDRPVAIGDFCRFGDRVGTVEDIGLRSTRLRTLDRTLVNVPNAQFAAMTLENFSLRDKVLFHFTLSLRRDTTPDQVRMLLQSVTRILKEHALVEAGVLPVRFVGVGTYSLDLEVFAYVLTPDFDQFLHIQQDLLLRILDAIEAAGTALALPTQATVSYPAANIPNHDNSAAPQGPVHA